MPESSVIRTKRDWLITVTDGTRTYTISKEVGDFQWDVPLYGVTNILDRGEMPTTPDLRKGDDQPMTLGWSMYLRDLGDTTATSTYQTILDLCHELDSGYTAETWVSTLGTASDVKTWTVKATLSGSSFGETDKTYSFPFSVLRASAANGDPDTVTVSGTSYKLKPTLT